MNKKLILPLVIGAGIIGLYFLMKNKKPPLVSVAPLGPRPQPTGIRLSVNDTGTTSNSVATTTTTG
jgi:hypothetical protein